MRQLKESVSVRLKADEVAALKRWAKARGLSVYEATQMAMRAGFKSLGVIDGASGAGDSLASPEAVGLLASVLAQIDGLSERVARVDRRMAWTTHASIAASLAARQHLKLTSPKAFEAAEDEGRKVMEDLGVYSLE